jgi:hypothetical protein
MLAIQNVSLSIETSSPEGCREEGALTEKYRWAAKKIPVHAPEYFTKTARSARGQGSQGKLQAHCW